jgi:hypothetical protein
MTISAATPAAINAAPVPVRIQIFEPVTGSWPLPTGGTAVEPEGLGVALTEVDTDALGDFDGDAEADTDGEALADFEGEALGIGYVTLSQPQPLLFRSRLAGSLLPMIFTGLYCPGMSPQSGFPPLFSQMYAGSEGYAALHFATEPVALAGLAKLSPITTPTAAAASSFFNVAPWWWFVWRECPEDESNVLSQLWPQDHRALTNRD